MKIRLTLSFLIPALLLGTLVAQDEESGEKVTIEWKFTKGDVLRYEFTQEMEMDVMGMTIEQETVFGFRQEITGVDDKGIATMKVTYDHIKYVMSGGGQDTEYDSEKDEKPDEGDTTALFFAAMVGKSFTMKLDKTGDIKAVEGYQEMMDKVFDDIDSDDPAIEMMRNQYNSENAESMFKFTNPYLPGKPVAEGDTWKIKDDVPIPSMGEMKTEGTSTLKEVKDGTAVIEQKTTMELKADEEGGDDPFGGMVEISDAGSESRVTWDLKNGRLKSMKGRMTMTMDAQGQEFEIVLNMSMKWAPKKKKKDRKDTPSEDKKKDKKDKDYR